MLFGVTIGLWFSHFLQESAGATHTFSPHCTDEERTPPTTHPETQIILQGRAQ